MAKEKATLPKIEPDNSKLPEKLLWLWDAPMFIDELQVGRFYDAVVRPDSTESKTTVTLSQQDAQKIAAKLGLEGKVGLGGLGQFLAHFVKPELTASGEGSLDSTSQSRESRTIELHTISTPERQLVQLTIHYLVSYADRLFLVDKPAEEAWREPDTIEAVPRALTFLNLPGHNDAHLFGVPETKIIPTAAEFQNGKIELIYSRLKGRDDSKPPPYPDRIGSTPQELRAERREYWRWFDTNFSATQAMIAVEEAAREHGRIQWIDYRVPVTTEGDTLHLHVCPEGKFDTGVFAYNFIKRGYKHGLRLVGTLKSEPDMNVLAIYER